MMVRSSCPITRGRFPVRILLSIGVWAWVSAGLPAIAQRSAPSNPRELLELHGIDASQLDRLHDGEPLGATDEETLIRMLQRFPRFPRTNLERWSQLHVDDWSLLTSAPADKRTAVYRLDGRVIRVERSPLLPEVAQRLEFSEYYRVTLRIRDSDQLAVICTRNVPRAWRTGHPIDERAGALGIFLKSGARLGDASELVFAADRVAWFPDRTNSDCGVTAAHVYLANLGFDVGLLDDARAENKKPLSLADRECFYQLLAALRNSNRLEFIAHSQMPLDTATLLRDPDAHHGGLFVLQGIARRAIKVRVDDTDVRERFGIDHYFQIDLFVDLNKQVIKLSNKESGQNVPVYENYFPVTVCVPSLPANLSENETLREKIVVHAAFFKLWTYSSQYVSSFDKRLRQVSPMLIGIEPRIIEPVEFNPGLGIGLATLFIVSLIGIWLGIRRQGSRVTLPRGGSPSNQNRIPESNEDAETALPDHPNFTNLN